MFQRVQRTIRTLFKITVPAIIHKYISSLEELDKELVNYTLPQDLVETVTEILLRSQEEISKHSEEANSLLLEEVYLLKRKAYLELYTLRWKMFLLSPREFAAAQSYIYQNTMIYLNRVDQKVEECFMRDIMQPVNNFKNLEDETFAGLVQPRGWGEA